MTIPSTIHSTRSFTLIFYCNMPKNATPKAIHINELRRALDISRIDRTPVDLDCWKGSDGSIIQYRGWLVKSCSWQQGTHNLNNPVNHQVRKVRDIFIFRYNDHSIYL